MRTDPQALKRVAFSPGEFAALFGKSQTWGYRQIYAGKVTAITEHGRILIPAKEVERILESAGIYEGMPKSAKSKVAVKGPLPAPYSVWQRFVDLRKQKSEAAEDSKTSLNQRKKPATKKSRSSIPVRIARSWKKG